MRYAQRLNYDGICLYDLSVFEILTLALFTKRHLYTNPRFPTFTTIAVRTPVCTTIRFEKIWIYRCSMPS